MKKKINAKKKGNRAELELAKILTKRFGQPFARVGVTSGARPKQVKLDGKASETFTGDLIVPEGFRFSVECKAVNINVDLLAPSALLDKFLKQVWIDARSIEKQPLLCWKRNNKGWIVAIPCTEFKGDMKYPSHFAGYRGWVVCRLDALMEIEIQDFWFELV